MTASIKNMHATISRSPMLFYIFLLSNCGPDAAPTPIDMSCAGRLAANDLIGLKPCLEGTWKIAYSKNQFGQKQLLANSFVRITSDSVYYFSEGDIIAESPIMLMPDPSPTISFTNWRDENFNWKIQSISDDTVFLADGNKHIALTPTDLQPLIECEGFFWHRPVNQTKHCIYGKWQLQYRYGGFSGNEKIYYSMEYIFDFRASDSLFYISNGVVSARRKLEWTKHVNILGYLTYMYTYAGTELQISRGVEQIKQDTLILYDDVSDGYGYYLSRRR